LLKPHEPAVSAPKNLAIIESKCPSRIKHLSNSFVIQEQKKRITVNQS